MVGNSVWSVFLHRLALLVFVLCAMSPLAASAHEDHGPGHSDEQATDEPSNSADAGWAGGAIAQAPCRDEPGHGCGCYRLRCIRPGNPAAIDVAAHAPVPVPADPIAPLPVHAVAPFRAPLTHPPRAPPLFS